MLKPKIINTLYRAVIFSLALAGCVTTQDGIKKLPPLRPTNPELLMAMEQRNKSRLRIFLRWLAQFMDENDSKLVALMALGVIWALLRVYNAEKRLRAGKINIEDLALMKIIRDSANAVWEKYRPGRKVIRLNDWKR